MKLSFFLTHVFIPAIFIASYQVHASDVASPCNIPKDVSYCMHMMRTGTQFDKETTNHFTGLSEKLGSVQVGSCDWKELEGSMSGNDCVRRLYEFADEQDSNREMFLETTSRVIISGRRCRLYCRRVCNLAPRGEIRRNCKAGCPSIAFRDVSRDECTRRCKNKCDNAPNGEPRETCKRTCELVIS